MKNETLAVHGGYDSDPTTKAVAVPIYQTVAYEFDSADHGAALFNLEVEGHRYSRISNPTVAVLERRVALLEGGIDALCASTGQAALNYAVLNLTAMGTNIVSVPQLYGTTYTLFGHVLPSQGVTVRFAESDRPDAVENSSTTAPAASSAKASATRPVISAMSKRWQTSPHATAFRLSSTIPLPRRSCCGRSTTAPILSYIR
jgi:O-acetylhomoserine/O-acetylserine sulfhydrylase-like pyridoxal-dependent enzyme